MDLNRLERRATSKRISETPVHKALKVMTQVISVDVSCNKSIVGVSGTETRHKVENMSARSDPD